MCRGNSGVSGGSENKTTEKYAVSSIWKLSLIEFLGILRLFFAHLNERFSDEGKYVAADLGGGGVNASASAQPFLYSTPSYQKSLFHGTHINQLTQEIF